MMSNYKKKNIPFNLKTIPIDYFKLEDKYFKPGFNVKKHLSTLKAGQYFSLPKNFDLDKKETVVFNLQVGQGKTTLCYDLIEQYEKRGYVVIVCSPFIKLVNKDCKEIKARVEKFINTGGIKGVFTKVFKYDDLYTLNHWGDRMKDVAGATRSIHVMTINCLLGNSGDTEFEQAFSKQDYLEDLLQVAKQQNKKVAIFFDEIHESVHNFSRSLIPNLLKWKDVVNKIFIASATFTPQTIPVIKAISLLTDKNIQIFETARVKNKIQANIHLHVCNTPAYPTTEFEGIITAQIEIYKGKGKNVNVITATKSLAEKIAESNIFSKTNISGNGKTTFAINEINLLTADTTTNYNIVQNNIGTTFKTGVNIDRSNDVLFVIFPNIKDNAALSHYGIFSDGITSIIQSIGRLRNGGDIHLFVNNSNYLIGDKQDYDKFFQQETFEQHSPINNIYDELLTKYKSEISNKEDEIKEMETSLVVANNIPIEQQKQKFGFYYPNVHEYILTESRRFALKHNNFSFGKLISPYVIWAVIYDQFTNAELTKLTYYSEPVVKVDIKNASITFTTILSQRVSLIKANGFRKSITEIEKYLDNNNTGAKKIKFEIDGKKLTSKELTTRKPSYLKELARATFQMCGNMQFPDSINEYVNACINTANKVSTNPPTALQESYQKLSLIKDEFLKRIKSSIKTIGGLDYILSENDAIIDDAFHKQAEEVIKQLKNNDILFKNKAFSFMQTNTFTKKNVYKLLTDLFLNLGKSKKQHLNQTYDMVKGIDEFANLVEYELL